MSAARVVLSCFDSIRFHINFHTKIITGNNFLSLIYFHHLIFKCRSLAGKEKSFNLVFNDALLGIIKFLLEIKVW